MIQTIRDAESKIGILQRELRDLKEKTHRFHDQLETVITELKSVQKPNQSNGQIDSIVSADGSQISHRLLHNFAKLHADEFEAVKIETQKLHITETLGSTNGGYLIADDEWVILSCGAEYNGSAWIARAAKAFILSCNPKTGNALVMSCNTGLTPGASFTPTQIVAISNSGDITARDISGRDLALTGTFTASTLNLTGDLTVSGLTTVGTFHAGNSTVAALTTTGVLTCQSTLGVWGDANIGGNNVVTGALNIGSYSVFNGSIYKGAILCKSGTITAGAVFTDGLWTA